MIKLLKSLFLALFAAIYLAVFIPSAFAEAVVNPDTVLETIETAISQKPDVANAKSKNHKEGKKRSEKSHKNRKNKTEKKDSFDLEKPAKQPVVTPNETEVEKINNPTEKSAVTSSETSIKNP